jgi:hypothetical protein
MKLTIIEAKMTRSREDGYVGHVGFQVEDRKHAYEITLYSKYGREWSYALNFLHESGSEEDILAIEELIEENDEWFDQLVQAARNELIEQ